MKSKDIAVVLFCIYTFTLNDSPMSCSKSLRSFGFCYKISFLYLLSYSLSLACPWNKYSRVLMVVASIVNIFLFLLGLSLALYRNNTFWNWLSVGMPLKKSCFTFFLMVTWSLLNCSRALLLSPITAVQNWFALVELIKVVLKTADCLFPKCLFLIVTSACS